MSYPENEGAWPELPLEAWQSTYDTLRLWMQVVGKIRLALAPSVNHWWGVALYVTGRGLSTSPIPWGERSFEITFDFVAHVLWIDTGEGATRAMSLAPRSVAAFYGELMELLASLGFEFEIDVLPKEIPDPIPFPMDHLHAAYDRDYAHRFWQALRQVDRLMKAFRSGFTGKCSPVHFFWGSFDHAVTRFSGRRAPPRQGADAITREGYSHELISHGWWPGGGGAPGPAFYAYASPEPEGFAQGPVKPEGAFYHPPTRGYLLRYEDVRRLPPRVRDRRVLEFFESTYELGARLAGWDRLGLERPPKPQRGNPTLKKAG